MFRIYTIASMLLIFSPTFAAEKDVSKPAKKRPVIEKQLIVEGSVKSVASVGLELITDRDVEERLKLILMFSQKALSDSSIKVLREYTKKALIEEKLRVVYAKRFAPPPEREWAGMKDVMEHFASIAQSNGKSAQDFAEAIEKQGVNMKTFYDQIYARLTWDGYMYAKYNDKVSFSEKEVKEKWQKTCDMLQKRAYHVERFFAPFSNEAEKKEAKELIDAVLELMQAGVDFQSVARQFSSGTEAISGGDLGFISDEQLPFAKENEALKEMKQHEIRVVEMNSGYSILRLNSTVSTSDDNGDLITVRYIVLPMSNTPTQAEAQEKINRIGSIVVTATDAQDMVKKAEEAGLNVMPAMDIPSKQIDPQLLSLLDNAKNGVSQVICTPTEALCACVLKRKKIEINLPKEEEIQERMISEKLNTLTAHELSVARKSINVEVK